MTPKQEQVYFSWKRLCWVALIDGSLPAVVVFQDRLDGKNYCVWTQWRSGDPTLKFFHGLEGVRRELLELDVQRYYPDLLTP